MSSVCGTCVAGDALIVVTLLLTLILSPQDHTGTLENVACYQFLMEATINHESTDKLYAHC